jgi:hypothetical protein
MRSYAMQASACLLIEACSSILTGGGVVAVQLGAHSVKRWLEGDMMHVCRGGQGGKQAVVGSGAHAAAELP